MDELEVWYSAYLAVLAGGMSSETARVRAELAVEDYNDRKCQQGADVVKSNNKSGI